MRPVTSRSFVPASSVIGQSTSMAAAHQAQIAEDAGQSRFRRKADSVGTGRVDHVPSRIAVGLPPRAAPPSSAPCPRVARREQVPNHGCPSSTAESTWRGRAPHPPGAPWVIWSSMSPSAMGVRGPGDGVIQRDVGEAWAAGCEPQIASATAAWIGRGTAEGKAGVGKKGGGEGRGRRRSGNGNGNGEGRREEAPGPADEGRTPNLGAKVGRVAPSSFAWAEVSQFRSSFLPFPAVLRPCLPSRLLIFPALWTSGSNPPAAAWSSPSIGFPRPWWSEGAAGGRRAIPPGDILALRRCRSRRSLVSDGAADRWQSTNGRSP